jgi:undecaprenyl-diphosphatase
MKLSARHVAHLRTWFAWLKSREPLVLLAVLAIVVGVWAFIELADEVLEPERRPIEERILQIFRDPGNPQRLIGPAWLEEMGRDLTALGSVVVLFIVSAAVCGFLWLDRKRRMALAVAAATLGGALVSTILKELFERPRPDVVPHLAQVHTASFPSGHSLMAAVVYLTLGAMLATVVQGRRLKVYVLAVALFLTLVVGASRVYLGVHWPSDVLAGWTAGLVWALGCWLVIRELQVEGRVEAEGESDTP